MFQRNKEQVIMENIDRNQFARSWRGAFGKQFVVHKTYSGKSIIAGKPLFDDNLAYTETGTMRQAAVRDAATYANFAGTHEVYLRRAEETGTSTYALAVADWFGAPKVLEIDVDGWRGNIGETIRVKARDNVSVMRVVVVIRNAQGQVLEMGDAVQSDEGSAWWNYTTQSSVPLMPLPTLQAIAFDLPGNRDSFTIS
jgi:hypothetical protein